MMSKTEEATNITLVQTIAIEKQLDMLTLECAALSDETRSNWLSTDAAIKVLEKRFSHQTSIRNTIALLITAVLASTFTFIASNGFDRDFALSKIKSYGEFSSAGNEPSTPDLDQVLRVADGVAECAITQTEPECGVHYSVADQKLPNLSQEPFACPNIYALKLSRDLYEKALLIRTNTSDNNRTIRKSLFAVNYWLGDYPAADNVIRMLRKDELQRNDLDGGERLANSYREGLILFRMKDFKGAQTVLKSALRLDADFSGRAGGTYTSPIAELYVRCLVMQKQYDQAREFIEEFSGRRQPYYKWSDYEPAKLHDLINDKRRD
jgi:hypothetical protein